MSEKEKTNISKIAQELGLSPTTVSRALSGKGRVSEKTKSMISDYIANGEIDPHVRSSQYSDKKTMNVCVTLPIEGDYAELPFFTKILMTLYDYFHVRDYHIVLAKTGQDNISALKDVVKHHKVDGVVLTRMLESNIEVDFLKEKKVPFVLTGTCPDESIYQVDVTQREACKELTDILLKMGIRKTVLMCGNLHQAVMQARVNGYRDAIRENDLPLDRRWIIENAADANVVEKAIGDILREQMECVICSDDSICMTVLNYFHQNGIRVPRDLRVASFYNSRILSEYDSSITSIDFDIKEMGKVAGGMLCRLMNGEPCEKKKKLGYHILLKESTKLVY